MLYRKLLVALVTMGNASTHAADTQAVFGEWAMDAATCSESRLTFTTEYRHEALMAEGDEWLILASAGFTFEGDVILVKTSEYQSHQRLRVIVATESALQLRTEDVARAEAIGTDTLSLVRCPPR